MGKYTADRICRIMSKNYWIHEIERDLRNILERLGIFSGKPVMRIEINHKFKPECYVSCAIKAKNNIFGKDINIMIKPDLGSEHMVLREAVQENSNVDMKAEDKDDERSGDIEIFVKELKALEKDIEKALRKFKQELAA